MPHQILAAVNHDGKPMPMCKYPEHMHDFQSLDQRTDAVDGVTVAQSILACTKCGAELRGYSHAVNQEDTMDLYSSVVREAMTDSTTGQPENAVRYFEREMKVTAHD